MSPGPLQILIIVLLIVVFFGASRVPAIAENLAKGIRSFKKGLKDEEPENLKLTESSDKDRKE